MVVQGFTGLYWDLHGCIGVKRVVSPLHGCIVGFRVIPCVVLYNVRTFGYGSCYLAFSSM